MAAVRSSSCGAVATVESSAGVRSNVSVLQSSSAGDGAGAGAAVGAASGSGAPSSQSRVTGRVSSRASSAARGPPSGAGPSARMRTVSSGNGSCFTVSSDRVGCCGMGESSGGRRPGVPGYDGAAAPPTAEGGAEDATASSDEAVIAGATIPPTSRSYVLIAVRVDDVDGDVTELALVLASVVPAEDEITAAREHYADLGESSTAVAVERNDEVIGGRGRRQRRGHLAHHSLSTARTRGCGSASCTAPGWPLVFPFRCPVTTDSPKEMSP